MLASTRIPSSSTRKALVEWRSRTSRATYRPFPRGSSSCSMWTLTSGWRWSRTSSTTRCATSARASYAAASTPRTFARTSHASRWVPEWKREIVPCPKGCVLAIHSTIASNAGPPSIRSRVASTTSHWSRREQIVPAPFLSAGVNRKSLGAVQFEWKCWNEYLRTHWELEIEIERKLPNFEENFFKQQQQQSPMDGAVRPNGM